MGIFSAAAADIQEFKNKLGADASHLLTPFESLIGRLTGIVESDASQVAADAEAAAGLVVAEVEADAADVAAQAVAGAEAVVEPNA